jgi:hypothetical protein
MSLALPYIVLFLSLFICGLYQDHIKDIKYKTYFSIVAVVIFFFFFGFRGFIAGDWTIYYEFFKRCTFDDVVNYSLKEGDFEPGFTLLCFICKTIYNDYFFFQFIVALIDTVLLVRFLRKAVDNIPYALILYITFNGFIISTDLLRNSIAIMIFLNSLVFIKERKIIPYMLLCTLALTFHTSSLFFYPLYFFFNKRCNKWLYLILFIISNIVFILHISIVPSILGFLGDGGDLENKIIAYTELLNESKTLSIGYLERLFTGFLLFIYYSKLKELRNDNAIYFNGIVTYLILSLLLSEFQVLSERITYLFSFGYWVTWLDLSKCFKYDNNRRLFKVFMIFYCLLRMSITAASSTDFKYENILFRHGSYQEKLYIKNRTGGLKGK